MFVLLIDGSATGGGAASAGARRTGRPPLTERRRAAIRVEIARQAVRLFTSKGVAGTSAGEIAAAAGLSVRTLWRHVPNKESAVWPLLTAGIETVARLLRAWPPGQGPEALLDDMERLRESLAVDRWLVCGGSWGSTLSLAYAERHPARVSEMVLFGVTTGRHSEVDWTFRGGLARFFPEQWGRLAAFAREPDVVTAIARLLADPDQRVREDHPVLG